MATVPEIEYPTSDGKPMAETDDHRELMLDLIETLKRRYAGHPDFYVSGNLLMYYLEGDKHRHVSPDVFAVPGVGKHNRDYYLIWEEGKGPALVIELTSRSTKNEDLKVKFSLYQDVLKVQEYFLFDPHAEYLKPPLQGFRLYRGRYVPIKAVKGRLPSKVLGLHLERNGKELRLYDPVTQTWLPTPREALSSAEAEIARLRQELEALRQRQADG
jgi:Uma2 family endonuclease